MNYKINYISDNVNNVSQYFKIPIVTKKKMKVYNRIYIIYL